MTTTAPTRTTTTTTTTESSVTLKAARQRTDRRAQVKRFLSALMRSLAAVHT